MTATTDARGALFAALALHPALDAGRVHRYSPTTIAAPCVYVADSTLFPRTASGSFTELVLQFEVVAVVDGADTAARELLDAWGDAIVDAALDAAFGLANRRASTLDVGGPTLRALSTFVETLLPALTLCPPTIGATTHE